MSTGNNRNRGFILITTLLVLAVLAAFCVSASREVRLHMAVREYAQDERHAARLLDDGLEYGKHLLTTGPSRAFPYQFVTVDGALCGLADDEKLELLVAETAGKFSINKVNRPLLKEILRDVCGMELSVDALMDSILDWREPSVGDHLMGGYYAQQTPAYAPRYGPLQRLEELLWVKDMTPVLFYGEDTNHNLILDPNEDDGDASEPADNHDGVLQLGIAAYAAVSKAEALNINAAPEHVWRTLFRAALPERVQRAPSLASQVMAFRAGTDGVLGTEDDQFFASLAALDTVLAAEGKNVVAQVQNVYPLALEPAGYEVTVRATLPEERVVRSCRADMQIENNKLLIATYRGL